MTCRGRGGEGRGVGEEKEEDLPGGRGWMGQEEGGRDAGVSVAGCTT